MPSSAMPLLRPNSGRRRIKRNRKNKGKRGGSFMVRAVTVGIGLFVVLFVAVLYVAQENLSDALLKPDDEHNDNANAAWTPFAAWKQRWLQNSNTNNDGNNRPKIRNRKASIIFDGGPPLPPMHDRFLIFRGFLGGQGAGNIMNGLLATHLLGQEFNRTVCVSPDFSDFHLAFVSRYESIDANSNQDNPYTQACKEMFEKYTHDKDHQISLINFGEIPNECELQRKLSDPTVVVWSVTANTYPRWPAVPKNFFFTYYRARPELFDMLPKPLPLIVVHLRSPDSETVDGRKGLDEVSLKALENHVHNKHEEHMNDVYLVTNNVDFYDRFPQWRHSPWQVVRHSATNQQWGREARKNGDNPNQFSFHGDQHHRPSQEHERFQERKGRILRKEHEFRRHPREDHDYNQRRRRLDGQDELFEHDHLVQAQARSTTLRQQRLQMWVDWYILLSARTIYHTHSDFSISAIHWQSIEDAWEINGMKHMYTRNKQPLDGVNPQTLELLQESWLRDGITPAMVDRRRQGWKAENGDLRKCLPKETGVWG